MKLYASLLLRNKSRDISPRYCLLHLPHPIVILMAGDSGGISRANGSATVLRSSGDLFIEMTSPPPRVITIVK